jgi:hypothetical protein
VREVGPRRRHGDFKVRDAGLQIYSIPGEKLPKVPAINNGESIETVDTRNHALGFEVREAADGNEVLFVCMLAS